ncbi:Protein LURP-one-related 15 [Linum perenne]
MAAVDQFPVNCPPSHQVVVISSRFLSLYPVELSVVTVDKGATVVDVYGRLIFWMKSKSLSLHHRRTVMDPSGNVLVSMSRKVRTLHGRWQLFRGDSNDLMFSVKESSMLHRGNKWDVFLAWNTNERVSDFRIKSDYEEGSCIVYLGNTHQIIAQMYKDHSTDAESYKVTINPNVDYAFIVCLVAVIIKGMKEYRKARSGTRRESARAPTHPSTFDPDRINL